MSNFSVVLFLLFGGAGLHLFQFVAILRLQMRLQRTEACASQEIPDICQIGSYQAADSGVSVYPARLSRPQEARRLGRRHSHAARRGAPVHGKQRRSARQGSVAGTTCIRPQEACYG